MANTRRVVAIALDADKTVYNVDKYHKVISLLSISHAERAALLSTMDVDARVEAVKDFAAQLRIEMATVLADASPFDFVPAEIRRKFVNAINIIAPSFMNELLIASNTALFEELKKLVAPADEVVIAIGSNRQSIGIDQVGASDNATGLFFFDIQLIIDHLSVLCPDKSISLFKGTLLDVSNNARVGDCYDAALDGIDKEIPYTFLLDTTKVSMHYHFTHSIYHACRLAHPDSTIEMKYYFIDDLPELCRGANKLFAAFPELLPSGVSYRYLKFADTRFFYGKAAIAGTGVCEENTTPSLQALAKLVLLRHPSDQIDLLFGEHMQQAAVFLRERQRQGSSLVFRSGDIASGITFRVVANPGFFAQQELKRDEPEAQQADSDAVVQEVKRSHVNPKNSVANRIFKGSIPILRR